MSVQLAVDTNAAADYIREDRRSPPQLANANEVALPITVLGELFYGAFHSRHATANRLVVERLLLQWKLLSIDIDTARIYGEVRAAASQATASLTASKINDLWIAAVCVQHELPLLTNDAGFDAVPGLRVLHW